MYMHTYICSMHMHDTHTAYTNVPMFESIFLSCPFQSSNTGDRASAVFQLMGGTIESLGGRMLGIDDGVSIE